MMQYVQCAKEGDGAQRTTELLAGSRNSPVLVLGGGENEKGGFPFLSRDAKIRIPNRQVQAVLQNIHLLLFPAGTTALLQPLDVGVYAPYKQFLRKWMENSQIVPVLEASRDAFSSAFTRVNIKEAWEETTLLSENHSTIENQLPVSNPFRHQSRHRNSGDDLLC